MTKIRNLTFGIVAAFIGSILVGCAFFQQVLPGLTLSDANVVGLLDSIDEGEMDAAQLAQTQASDPDVQAFAGRVLNEHRDLAEANGRLAAQLSLEPERPSLASHLKQAHEQAMRSLRALSGAAFDRAYVRYEIQQHVQAFNVHDRLPGVKMSGREPRAIGRRPPGRTLRERGPRHLFRAPGGGGKRPR